MKMPSLLNKLSRKQFLLIWLFFHLGIIVYFGANYFSCKGNMEVDADLLNMFPKSFNDPQIRVADEALTELTGQNVFVLIANEDFDKAKAAAENVYNKMNGSKNFTTLSLYSNSIDFDSVLSVLQKYRFNLLDDATIDLINENPEAYAEQALMTAFSPFTLLPLDNLESDPFMFTETIANIYVNAAASSGIAMSVKDGVLAAQSEDGIWYIMLRVILSKEGASLGSKTNGVAELYSTSESVETYGSRFIFTGTPVNSFHSSTSAKKEISIITTVSLLAVIIMLLIVFRNPLPILCSVGSIVVSILIALLATIGTFHKLHILTLVFGTSLIGSCIDYSLHYFTHWAGNEQLNSTEEIRNHLIAGLSMAIISSGLCYIILLFAPFNLLKQMSLFSITGLISSYLTTLCIYPYIPLPKNNRQIKLLSVMKPIQNKERQKLIGRTVITALFVFSIGSILIFHNRLSIRNDLYKLYEMKGKILEDRLETLSLIKYNPNSWYIIRGDSENEILEKEEILCKKIDEATDGNVHYLATSKFVPSEEHQKRSREACKKLFELAEYQYEILGLDPANAELLKEEFNATEGDFVSFENGNIPDYVKSSISTVWLGKINGKYFSVVMPNIVSDHQPLKKLVAQEEDISYISKMTDIAEDLDKLTIMVLKFFAVAYLFMFVVLKFFYKWKQAMKIISVPMLIILMTGAIFAINGTDLEFFSVTGLILVFGLGLDYIIYMMENEKNTESEAKTIEPFATMLSFLTTVISFGALALSSFVPVHLMGLSIFLGLTTAYISTIFYDRSL